MQEFYIDVVMYRGLTRIQVDEVPPEGWTSQGKPQFIIEFYADSGFLTLTLQLENGIWYDRNTRLSAEDYHLRFFEPGPDEAFVPNYKSPLSTEDIRIIGNGISNYMVVALTSYMGLFIPQFRTPTLN
ncbi:hypothetical protein GCM10023149_31140 [Mucilaginibacter gynuensis]|uniref:Uncharacterized protein n=1 Tax=Mucilaginibacter gynuensis TaxID=1302236 RepID=A0ABP8GNR0_9SPHI